ncbi:MAG: tetratricopeptide repeat protein [Leptolyngbya sp.]|nr:tetratricopeptide repeat protein [Candidatus Melainabacteria bacterium]
MKLNSLDYIVAVLSGGFLLGALYLMWRNLFSFNTEREKIWFVNDSQLQLYETVWRLFHEGNNQAAKATSDLLTADTELHPRLSMRVNHILALIAVEESDHGLAFDLLHEALDKAEKYSGPLDQLFLSSALAAVYFKIGQMESAYKYLARAADLFDANGVPNGDPQFRSEVIAPIHRNLANLLEEAGQSDLSIQHLEKAIGIWSETDTTWLYAANAEQDLLAMQRRLIEKLFTDESDDT